MPHLAHIALLVRDYDEALAFYIGKLGFTLAEDSYQSEHRRWVTIRSPMQRLEGAPSIAFALTTTGSFCADSALTEKRSWTRGYKS